MSGKYLNPHYKIDDSEIIQYLLGQLSEDQREGLESRLFAGENFEQLERIEEDLIETYLRGKLRPNEKSQFEEHFLKFPRRRSRVEFTKALLEVLDGGAIETRSLRVVTPKPKQSWLSPLGFAQAFWRFSTAGAALALLSGGLWLGFEHLQFRIQSRDPLAKQNSSSPQPSILASPALAGVDPLKSGKDEKDSLRTSPSPFEVLGLPTPGTSISPISLPSFALAMARVSRGSEDEGGQQKLVLPGEVHQFQLVLSFPVSAVYRRFLASIQTPEGQLIIATRARLIAPGKVSLTLNADRFRTDDYILTLTGSMNPASSDEIADYPFRIIRN